METDIAFYELDQEIDQRISKLNLQDRTDVLERLHQKITADLNMLDEEFGDEESADTD